MSPLRRLTTALLFGGLLAVAGCSDLPTAPETPVVEAQPAEGLLGDLTDALLRPLNGVLQLVTVAKRTDPLEHDEVVSQVIGRNGGTIRLPEAGLTLWIPRYALRSNTRITVTAPAGDLVGYHFEPHGLQFRRPVTVTQDLLSIRGLPLFGTKAAYFQGELTPQVEAEEIIPVGILGRLLGIFQIEHFSGYVIATE